MISPPNYHPDSNFVKKLPGVPSQKLVHRVNSIQQEYIPLPHLSIFENLTASNTAEQKPLFFDGSKEDKKKKNISLAFAKKLKITSFTYMQTIF